MSRPHRLAATSPIGLSWTAWVDWLSVPFVGDPFLAYEVKDGRPAGTWPTDAVQRVYLALDADGKPQYAGQTRGTLAGRLAGHRRTEISSTWAWLLLVTVPDASAHELDAIEASARRFFLPGRVLAGRRHPHSRVRV